MADKLALEKIKEAEILIKKLEAVTEKDIFGIKKLRKKIDVEIIFLKKGLENKNLKVDSVLCSNLGQLSSIGEGALSFEQVSAVLKKINISNNEKLLVDVVGGGGTKWYKIILRNPKALHFAFVNGTKKGGRSIDKIALTYVEAAKLNPVLFCPPKIYFVFISGVSNSLASCLRSYGINISGDIIDDCHLNVPDFNVDSSDEESTSDGEYEEFSTCSQCVNETKICDKCNCLNFQTSANLVNKEKINSDKCIEEENYNLNLSSFSILNEGPIKKRVNLDVSCMIAYTSATCNGDANFIFKGKFLTEQAEWERRNPVKKVVDKYFEGCELIACQEAATHFKLVLDTVGGPAEIERGYNLIKRCTLVNSEDVFKDQLPIGGRIKKLSRLIFGTGQALRAPTVTSNIGFIRASENKGLNLAVLYHEPRALTEKKQSTAIPILETESSAELKL